MKDNLKSLLLFLALPMQGKRSILVSVSALSEFYRKMKNDKQNDNRGKETAAQCGQIVCDGLDRQYQHDIKGKENTVRHGA